MGRKEREPLDKRLDALDRNILRELARDSRKSFREVARSLNVATSTVISKYNRLVQKGVIRRAGLVIDYEKVGYSLSVAIELTVAKGKLLEVEEKIGKRHNVYAVYDITGDSDALILARFRNRNELNDFVKSLLAMEYVQRTNTHVVLNVVKEDFSSYASL